MAAVARTRAWAERLAELQQLGDGKKKAMAQLISWKPQRQMRGNSTYNFWPYMLNTEP